MYILILLYLIIVIHELSHAFAIVFYGHQVRKIQFGSLVVFKFNWKFGVAKPISIEIGTLPFFGFCSFDSKLLTPKQKIGVALAGPFGNIIAGFLSMAIYYTEFKNSTILESFKAAFYAFCNSFVWMFTYLTHFGFVPASEQLKTTNYLFLFSLLSLLIGGSNLFPLFPLDGGHILVNSYEIITKKEFPKRAKNMMLFVSLLTLLVVPLLRGLITSFSGLIHTFH